MSSPRRVHVVSTSISISAVLTPSGAANAAVHAAKNKIQTRMRKSPLAVSDRMRKKKKGKKQSVREAQSRENTAHAAKDSTSEWNLSFCLLRPYDWTRLDLLSLPESSTDKGNHQEIARFAI